MIKALTEGAFFPECGPETLWRASCVWAAQGGTEQAEWLHEMAVNMLDIRELPTAVPAGRTYEPTTLSPAELRAFLLERGQAEPTS